MAKSVSMNKTVQEVRAAYEVARRALPATADPGLVGAVTAAIARVFMENGYVNDLGPESDDQMPRLAGQ